MTINAIEASEIFAGIYQLKMPLPFRLNHINLYLLEDLDGWYLIDTGLNTELSQQLWATFLQSGFFSKPIKKIILTHLHPDHIGMSAWLSAQLAVPVAISAGDWAMANFLWNNGDDIGKKAYEQHWAKFGLPEAEQIEMVELRSHYKKLVKQLPENVEVIRPHDRIFATSGTWEFLPGAGHSPEHMALWNSSSKILISGDHLLPTITPNISLHPTALSNPLESYLASLEEFSKLDCAYYLPAHGPVSSNFHERINQITLHHQQKFAQLMNQLPTRCTVFEALPFIFTPDLPAHQMLFAYGETAAHLIYLAERGLLLRDSDNAWVFVNPFQLASTKYTVVRAPTAMHTSPC